MTVDKAYGEFVEEPTRLELERFFIVDDVDRDLIALRRTRQGCTISEPSTDQTTAQPRMPSAEM
ncbi:hypothetical protein [Streptomyces sp. IBSBF 3136]|uniref:hypothetical protein n=1 Tax=Streptomyces sp. IBSBF 3136 TaxID=2903524 RepID=UPI002FDC1256